MNVKKVKKRYIVICSIVILLIVARVMLPYFVTRFVNKVLADIPDYTGSIADVDIHLTRGAYTIHDLSLFKLESDKKIPFIAIPAADFSVEWQAIFKGSLVGKIVFTNPQLNFIAGNETDSAGRSTNQTGESVDWTVPIKQLMPLQINHFEIENGSIFCYDFTTKPLVSVHLKQLQLIATNLSNADKKSIDLPSKVNVTATSIGSGQLTLNMNISVLKRIPDFDMDMKFESINMTALNDFFFAYAGADVEKGTFNINSELTINDGKLTGYVNPLAVDVKIASWKNDNKVDVDEVWQSVIISFVEVFTNQKKDQFVTKASIEEDLNKLKTQTWPTVWSIFRKAFAQAFDRNTDKAIIFIPRKFEETKKEKRKREREERKNRKRSTE